MRVLVVEDEPKMAGLLARGLGAQGAVVDLAPCGEEALWRAIPGRYDAIVLDVMLPGIDGVETCRRLRRGRGLVAGAHAHGPERGGGPGRRARRRRRRLPGQALRLRGARRTPAGPRAPRAEGAAGGAGGRRPAARPRREARASRAIPRSRCRPPRWRCLRRSCAARGRSSTPLALLEAGWPDVYENRSNIVAVYVGYLRNKIDRPFGRDDIETVRGAGYRLRRPGR